MSQPHFVTLEAETDGPDAWVQLQTEKGERLRVKVSKRAATAMGAILAAVGAGAEEPMLASFMRKEV